MNGSSVQKCFKLKFYEDWIWKLSCKIEFFVLINGYQNCLDKSIYLYTYTFSIYILNVYVYIYIKEYSESRNQIVFWNIMTIYNNMTKESKSILGYYEIKIINV